MPEDESNSLHAELTITPEQFAFQNGICNEETRKISKEKLNECYGQIINIFREYVDMPEDYYKFVSLWVVGTYFHDRFDTYPYLFFNAMRGSGKSRVLRLIAHLGSKGDGRLHNNITEANLFRIPKGVTTCIDEVEQIGAKEKQTLRQLLNSAYKRGNKIERLKKVKFKGEETQVKDVFELFIPIAMANITGVEEVLADRSVVLILEKSNNPLYIKKVENFENNEKFALIKKTLNQCSLCSVVTYKNIYTKWNNYIDNKYISALYTYNNNNYTTIHNNNTNLEEEEIAFFNKIDELGITGRNFELMFPLFLVAHEISDECFTDVLKISKSMIDEKRDDEYTESKDVSFIEFLSMQEDARFNYVPVKELAQRFRTFLGDQDSEDRWINDKWVGRALKRLNLIQAKKRVASGIIVIAKVDKAKERIKMFKREDE